MRSNRVYTFQYNAGSGSYRLAPEDSASGQQQADAPKGGGEQGRSAEDDIRPEEGVLADGVCFQPDNSPDPDIVEAARRITGRRPRRKTPAATMAGPTPYTFIRTEQLPTPDLSWLATRDLSSQ